MNNANNSSKFLSASLAGLLLMLFLSGVFMVVEAGKPDPADPNKKWFGTAYLIFAAILGMFYIYTNLSARNNSIGN
jgi:hypothetical protein